MEAIEQVTIRRVALAIVVLCMGALYGCGYEVLQVTAPPPTVTPTACVHWSPPRLRATATPVPATPLPTFTFTPTPTPIIHVVKKGETLLGIAYQYDVSIKALLEANEIPNPNSLPIGQRLVIPPDDASAVVRPPTPTPTPMPLQVVNVAFHRTPVGSLWCMGEVENERDEFLDLVQVQVSLYDAKGRLLDRSVAFVLTDVVPAHSKAPFAVLLPRSLDFAGYQIDVLSAEPIVRWGARHRALSVEWLKVEEGKVRGEVFNHGEADARQVRVTVTAYGDDGTVVGVRQVEIASLPAGERASFVASLIPAAPVARVAAVAWGMK